MSRNLWLGSGTLFMSLFLMKQYIFNEVKDIRDMENKTANTSLHNAYSNAKQFSIKPLTPNEKQELLRRKLINAKDFKITDDDK